jgi:hypothetical protein
VPQVAKLYSKHETCNCMAAIFRPTKLQFLAEGVELNVAAKGENYSLMWSEVRRSSIQ